MDDEIDELYELITGEDGFLVNFRCQNQFSDVIYRKIIDIIKSLTEIWVHQETISKKGFMGICLLVDQLSGGNRFLSESDALKAEDASIELMEILSVLE